MFCTTSSTRPKIDQTQPKRIQEQERGGKGNTTSFPFAPPKAIRHTKQTSLPCFALTREPSTSNTGQSTQYLTSSPHKPTETFQVQTNTKIPHIFTPSNFVEALTTYTEIKTRVPTDHNPHIKALTNSVDSSGIKPTDFCYLVKNAAKAQTVKLHDPDGLCSSTPMVDYKYNAERMAEIASIASKSIQEPGETHRAAEKIELELQKLESNRRKPKVIYAPEKEKEINTWGIKQCKTWVNRNASDCELSIPKMIKTKKVAYKATQEQIKSAEEEKRKATNGTVKYKLPPHLRTEKKINKLREYQQKVDKSNVRLELLTRDAEKQKKDCSNLNNWKNYQAEFSKALKKARGNGEITQLNVFVQNTPKLNTTAVDLPPLLSQRNTNPLDFVADEPVTVLESRSHQPDKIAELRTELAKVKDTPQASKEEIEKHRLELDTSLRNSSTPCRPQVTSWTLKCFPLSTHSPLDALDIVKPHTGKRSTKIQSKDGILEESVICNGRRYEAKVKVEEYRSLDTASAPAPTPIMKEEDMDLPDVPSDSSQDTPKDYEDSIVAKIFDLPKNVEITDTEREFMFDEEILLYATEKATIKDKYKGEITFKITSTVINTSFSEPDSDSD